MTRVVSPAMGVPDFRHTMSCALGARAHSNSSSNARGRALDRSRVVANRASPRVANASTKAMKIAFLGCGIMGVPMAKNLLNAGHEVIVWNRTSAATAPVVEAGAREAKSASEACAAAEVTFVMVSTPEAALAVARAAKDGLSAGKGYVDVSTVDAKTSSEIAAIVRSTGAEFLEAPVSGSKKPAEDGALIFLCAGDEALYGRCQAPLETMGKAHFFLGEVGQGAKMKLVVNMIMGSMMGAFAEGLTLSEKCDLDPDTLLQVISLGAIASPMFALKGPSMNAGKFAPAFPLKHQQKDMRLAIALADELAQEMPVAAAANELYKRARRDGCDDEDFSAVLKAVKK